MKLKASLASAEVAAGAVAKADQYQVSVFTLFTEVPTFSLVIGFYYSHHYTEFRQYSKES